MKKITFLLTAILFSSISISYASNKHHHPKHNNCEARYYYIPEIDSYYDMSADLYIYRDCNVWRRSYRLPRGLRWYDRNNIVILHGYHGPTPYRIARNHYNKNHHHKRYNNHRRSRTHYKHRRHDNRRNHYSYNNSRNNNSHKQHSNTTRKNSNGSKKQNHVPSRSQNKRR